MSEPEVRTVGGLQAAATREVSAERLWKAALGDWAVKRGILYLLIEAPMVAFLLGVAFRWLPYPLATVFTVLVAFAALPAWISYRRARSADPEEAVHHFQTYALWALFPYVVYNIFRVPMFYLLGVAFWNHWSAFGSVFARLPADRWLTLISGTIIHALQGYVLVLGYYVLFKRRTLLNSLAYNFVFLSMIYSTVFPLLILADFRPGPKWYFVVWWAHFWLAITAWYVPKLYGRNVLARFRSRASQAAAIALVVLLYAAPFLFVSWKTATWQFPRQKAIDAELFKNANLVLSRDPVLASKDDRARLAFYRMNLTFGPRHYKDWVNATKALDAGPVQVTGRLENGTEPIGFCYGYVHAVESPNTIPEPWRYTPALERMKFTSIPIDCSGPVEALDQIMASSRSVTVRWTAVAILQGDRESASRKFGGFTFLDVRPGKWTPTAPRPDPSAERRVGF